MKIRRRQTGRWRKWKVEWKRRMFILTVFLYKFFEFSEVRNGKLWSFTFNTHSQKHTRMCWLYIEIDLHTHIYIYTSMHVPIDVSTYTFVILAPLQIVLRLTVQIFKRQSFEIVLIEWTGDINELSNSHTSAQGHNEILKKNQCNCSIFGGIHVLPVQCIRRVPMWLEKAKAIWMTICLVITKLTMPTSDA